MMDIDRLHLAGQRIMAIAVANANRRIARFGFTFRIHGGILLSLWLAVTLLLILFAAFAGLIVRQLPHDPVVVVFLSGIFNIVAALLTLGSYPALRRSLLSPQSWRIYADAGISVRLFALARIFFSGTGKYLSLLLATTTFMISFTLGNHVLLSNYEHFLSFIFVLFLTAILVRIVGRSYLLARVLYFRTLPDRRKLYFIVALTVTGPLTIFLSFTALRAFFARPGDGTPRIVADLSSISATAYETSGTMAPALLALIVCAALYGIRLFARLGRAPWSAVMNVCAGEDTAAPIEFTLPNNPIYAIATTDLRRLLRSASARLNMVLISLSILCGIICGLVIVNWWLTAAGIDWLHRLPASTPAIIAGAFAASVTFTVHSALPAVFDLDADRNAYKLWMTIPHMLRRVAVTRAATRSLLLLSCGIPATIVGIALTAIKPASYLIVFLSTAAVIAVAPSLSTMVSLMWPHLGWKEIGEIGTIGISRYLLTYQLPPMLVLTVALTSTITLSDTAAIALGITALCFAPIMAAALVFGYATIVRWPRIDRS